MHLGWVELRAFRSYPELQVQPDPAVNVLVGPNGAGKTNFLEAVGYLARLRSFRNSPDDALVAIAADAAYVRGGFLRDQGELRVEVEIPRTGRRTVLVNGKRLHRHADISGHVHVVAFLPDDLDLVKRGPVYRRDYLDDLAAQLWPAAGADQAEFARALRQRNALLRREGRDADVITLEVWDQRLAAAGGSVLERRLRLLDLLRPVLRDAYGRVGGGEEAVDWTYESAWWRDDGRGDGAAAMLHGALTAARRTDLERRTTTVGPHRDEPGFLLGGRDARVQASQGEQRSVALGLRLAAYDLLVEHYGEPPVLLLDDVFSELDPVRTAGVVSVLPHGQVFVSTAREEDVPVSGRRWLVGEGKVT